MANHLPVDKKGVIWLGGPVSRSTARLRVLGDDLDPNAVTKLLECEPTSSNRKGDRRKGGTTGNEYLQKTGSWTLRSSSIEEEDLDSQLRGLLARVTSDLEVWRALGSEYSVNVFCGLFMGSSNQGLQLSRSTLKMLVERGIELQFDIYGPDFEVDLEGHLSAGKPKKINGIN